MKVYLDTTTVILFIFGQQRHPDRYVEIAALFDALDTGRLQAVVSIYALQELCAFCYGNFPVEQAPRVTRLAFYELLGHELLLAPLLSRMDRIILSRRFPLKDTSDQAHVATAFHNGCQAIITYDQHYQDIADRFSCLTAGEALVRLATESPQDPDRPI